MISKCLFPFLPLLYPSWDLIIIESFEKQWTDGLLQIPCTHNQYSNTFFIIYHFPLFHRVFPFGDALTSPPRLPFMFFLTYSHPHTICWRAVVQRRGSEICSSSCPCWGQDLPLYRQKWAAGMSEMSSQGNKQVPLFCLGVGRVVSID